MWPQESAWKPAGRWLQQRDDEEIRREELKRDQAREAVMLEQEKKDRDSAESLQIPKAPPASPPQK